MHRRFLTLLVLLPLSSIAAQGPSLVADSGRRPSDSRGGGAHAMHIVSAILGETRRINVVLPASYARSASGRRYPVTVVLDGETSLAVTAAVSDELVRNGQIPESIIVAVENTNRLRDLTPPGLSVSGSSLNEGGDRFLDFIERELLPAVDRQFRGATPRTLIGHSSGGILATYAAATRATYACIVALDTPMHLGENWLVQRLTERAAAPLAPLRYAAYEARFGWDDSLWKSFAASTPSTWQVHREKLARETHESMPFLGMYLGLREVFKDYATLAAPVSPTTSTLPYYEKLRATLGASVVPPRSLLANVREDLLMEGRGAAARAAYNEEVAAYGAPANAERITTRIAAVERQPLPKETVEGLLATPFPSPAEASAWLGEWHGDIWMNEDELRTGRPPTVVRLYVDNGTVKGEHISHPAPGVRDVQVITYLKLSPNGFTWGYMNGMRPRGMLLYEGTIDRGVLGGLLRLGGVNFTFPDGEKPPPIKFAFKKQ